MMKKVIFLTLFLSTVAFSQPTSYMEILKSDVKTQRRALITGAMGLSEEQAQKFWPVYKDYENAYDKLLDRELEIIKEYADNYENLSDEMADILINKAMDLNRDELDLNKEYYKKMKKELGAKVATKFRMVDNRINLMISLQVASAVPIFE